jgi:hypothetical protein
MALSSATPTSTPGVTAKAVVTRPIRLLCTCGGRAYQLSDTVICPRCTLETNDPGMIKEHFSS